MRKFPEAHLAALRMLAAYAIDPYAPQSCRDAKAELERIESAAQVLEAVTPETVTFLSVGTPDAADWQGDLFG